MRSAVIVGVAALLGCAAGGCQNSLLDRSLVFATHTTTGLEVSINPVEGVQSPVRLIIGYKRSEGVLNPVYHSDGVEGPPLKKARSTFNGGDSSIDCVTSEPIGPNPPTIKRYRPDAYSVIAKFTGDVNSAAAQQAQGRLAVAQWFATGEAAVILARAPGIAGAVSGSAEIAKEAAKQGIVAARSPKVGALRSIFQDLNDRASGAGGSLPDSVARSQVERLDSIAADLPEIYDFTIYRAVAVGPGQFALRDDGSPRIWPSLGASGTIGFNEVLDYWSNLADSINTLRSSLGPGQPWPIHGTDTTVNDNRSRLQSQLARQEKLLLRTEEVFGRNPAVQAVLDEYMR